MSTGKEYSPLPEFNYRLLEAYAGTFFNRQDCYAIQKDSGEYICVKHALTHKHLLSHFIGKLTLGTYALEMRSVAHWLCFDADQAEQFDILRHIAERLQIEGIASYLETSRRGGHLWLFTPPLSGQDIRQFGKELLRQHQLNTSLVELYPKQDHLKTGVGSLVRLPLGIHRLTGKRYSFITPEGEPLAPTIRQQIALLTQPDRVPLPYIEQMIQRIPDPTLPKSHKLLKKRASSGETVSERIKSAISVLEFVSRYVELDGHGKGFCPFHGDEHQSFQVNSVDNYWSCYAGCGGGSVIDFWIKWRIQRREDGSFTTVIRDLAQQLL